MKSATRNIGAAVFTLLLTASQTPAEKFAGAGFSQPVGARALALGGATIAGAFDGSAGFWNPAGLNTLNERTLNAMHSETFGELLNHDFVGAVFPNHDTTAFLSSRGAYLYYLGGSGVNLTDIDPATGRPEITGESSHGNLQLGLSGATHFGALDIGVTLRLLYSDIVFTTAWGASLDLGALYSPHTNLTLGLTVTDITSGFLSYSDGASERINPTVKPGLLYTRTFDKITLRALASGDVRFEGRKATAQYYQSDISLDTHYGLEFSYLEKVFGRLGADVGDLTLGAGFNAGSFSVDVSLLDHEVFDNSYRMSVGWRF